jgi:hypothetical protein
LSQDDLNLLGASKLFCLQISKWDLGICLAYLSISLCLFSSSIWSEVLCVQCYQQETKIWWFFFLTKNIPAQNHAQGGIRGRHKWFLKL